MFSFFTHLYILEAQYQTVATKKGQKRVRAKKGPIPFVNPTEPNPPRDGV